MAGEFTRREIGTGLLASVSLAAQTDAGDPRVLLEEARERFRTAVSEMKEVELDLNAQPAFVFKP